MCRSSLKIIIIIPYCLMAIWFLFDAIEKENLTTEIRNVKRKNAQLQQVQKQLQEAARQPVPCSCVSEHDNNNHTSFGLAPITIASTVLKAKSQNEKYYDDKYHKWQIPMNVFGAFVKGDFLNALARHMSAASKDPFPSSVLEFGSSAGYIIDAVVAHGPKFGVEVGDYARSHHTKHFPHIQSLKSPDEAPPGIDFVYSWSVLEHVNSPVKELQKLEKLLSPAGILFIHVKNEGMMESQYSWKPGDINNHIYTWNGLILGNLVQASGLQVCETASQFEAWHNTDPQDYKSNKCQWCKRNLDHGKKMRTQSVYAVAARLGSTTCVQGKKALKSVLSCKWLCEG